MITRNKHTSLLRRSINRREKSVL